MFGEVVRKEALRHARETYPKESVGFVVGGEYRPQKNISNDAENSFLVSAMAYLKYKDSLQAIIHSHPGGPFYPNKTDMQGQLDTALPWGIVQVVKEPTTGNIIPTDKILWFGDQAPVPPLEGRGFVHGVTDCYSLIRDYYRLELGITLKEFPRDWEWWLNGEELYKDGFAKTGFVPVPMSSPIVGDVFLASIRSKTMNHGGVWLGGSAGEILHHLTSRDGYDPSWLSRKEPGIRYMKYVQNGGVWIRHKETM